MKQKKIKITEKHKQIFDEAVNGLAYGMMIMVQDKIHIDDVKALSGPVSELLLPNGQKVQIQIRILFDESNFLEDLVAVETTKPLENNKPIVN